MNGTVRKRGDSRAVRIPKRILAEAMIKENDAVIFSAEANRIVITKARRGHKTLKERLAKENGGYSFKEWDTGAPCGGEIL